MQFLLDEINKIITEMYIASKVRISNDRNVSHYIITNEWNVSERLDNASSVGKRGQR